MTSAQKSCSVPEGMGERLEKAAQENDMLESEVIRRALRYYEDANPDGFAAFQETSHGPSVAHVDRRNVPVQNGQNSGLTAGGIGGVGRGRVPSESGEKAGEKVGEKDGENGADDGEDVGVYDPTEDMGREEE